VDAANLLTREMTMPATSFQRQNAKYLAWTLSAALLAAGVGKILPAQAQEIADPPIVESTRLPETPAAENLIARLGAIVQDAPEDGVYVSAITPLGAADRAGIRPGDYLLSVNARDIETPAELSQLLDSLAVDAPLSMTVRRGDTEHSFNTTLQIQDLPTESAPYEEPTTGTLKTGWLGVAVEEAPVVVETGVFVERIWLDSPAYRAGLRIDDRIVRIGDSPIHSPGDLTRTIRALDPYAKVTVVVDRHGAIHEIPVQLGDMSESRTSFHPQHWTTVGEPDSADQPSDLHQRLFQQNQRLERLVTEMMRDIEALQMEVRSLRRDMPDTNLDGTGKPIVPTTPVVPAEPIP
jgi:predicted metalloprotease with PDZ domain